MLRPIVLALAFILGPCLSAQVITSFSPTAGSRMSNVTLIGHDFGLLTTVTFNGQAATFTVIDDTRAVAQVPLLATTGPIGTDVWTTYPVSFLVLDDAPKITSFSPSAGRVGTVVNIIGRGLGTATTVTFNGVPAAFVVVSDRQLKATVPAGATKGPLGVVSPFGSSSTGFVKFTVY